MSITITPGVLAAAGVALIVLGVSISVVRLVYWRRFNGKE